MGLPPQTPLEGFHPSNSLLRFAPEAEREQVEALLRRCMENAASLRVPLIADVHSGRSWYDTK